MPDHPLDADDLAVLRVLPPPSRSGRIYSDVRSMCRVEGLLVVLVGLRERGLVEQYRSRRWDTRYRKTAAGVEAGRRRTP